MHYFIYIVNLMLTTLLLCVSLLYGEAMFVLVSCILMMNNFDEYKDCDSEEAMQFYWTQAQAEEEALRRHEQWLEMYNNNKEYV